MLLHLLEQTVDACFSVIPRNKPSSALMQSACLIAHRGAHDHAQGIIENTLAAFGRAQKLGCWGIELDVRTTADKVLVVNHDATLKRLWGYNQAIADLKFEQLRALVPDIPSLREVLQAYGGHMHLFIELKAPFCDENILIETLKDLTGGRDYHLLTLDEKIFYSLSQFPKSVLLLVASHNNVKKFCDLSLKEQYGGVLGHYFLVKNKAINRLQTGEQITGVGMVNSRYSVYRELSRGIKWIFTDRASEMMLCLPK